jgi:error-prone DNA polymerase
MPDSPPPKPRAHPLHASPRENPATHVSSHTPNHPSRANGYAELEVTSNYTFLTGASYPEEYATRAAQLGHRAIAITDTNTLAGIVRAYVAAKQAGIQLVVGARLTFTDAPDLSTLVYPTDRNAYARLCRLLTLGKRRAAKGECSLTVPDLLEHSDGLLAVAVLHTPTLPMPSPQRPTSGSDNSHQSILHTLQELRHTFNADRLSLALSRQYRADDEEQLAHRAGLAKDLNIPLLATNAAHAHTHDRRPLQDVLTCIRHGCTIAEAGFRLHQNAERHLKPPSEMARLFAAFPGAVVRTVQIAERTAGFSLDQLKYEYPEEVVPAGKSAMQHLTDLTWEGAARRYPQGVPEKVRAQILHELRLIDDLNYPAYFLTVHEIVDFAVARGILCQGRGAAANSAVCYCLGVTAVDPDRVNVLFERFISKERDEPPDIDIDFEHERREEVIQHLYQKYGRDRAALTAEVISYRGRSAVRDVGKAMGLSLDAVAALAKDIEWWSDAPTDPAKDGSRLRELGLNPADPHLQLVLSLARELMGFPRHLSQHVGGFVITRTPLSELVPIENAAMADRTVIEWDKDDIEAMGMLKVDVLGLGMLSCIRKAFELVQESQGEPLTLATIPAEDPATYDMICQADTVGVFQIESRAQMSMLPRLKPRCYYDLVIEVAIVRPGPIQGQMVHPYLKRRSGQDPITYHSSEIERVLSRTLGVPLFQEQAMSLAVVAAGFTPGEADQLRRAIASWKRSGNAIKKFEKQLIEGMLARGHGRQFAEQVFTQISGFSGYGFPESHAASFALLVYASSWLKRHKPAAFAAALINSQPMGFYQPAQIIRDAQQHGVEVRPVDVHHSRWDCTLEHTHPGGHSHLAIRLGMRLVKGLRSDEAARIIEAVQTNGPIARLDRMWRISGAKASTLLKLAEADAFQSMGLTRQRAVWAIQKLSDEPMPLFEQAPEPVPTGMTTAPHTDILPAFTAMQEVTADYGRVGLSLKAHPVSFVRDTLDAQRVTRNALLSSDHQTPAGRRVTVGGIVLVRQRPGTASGIVFMTIEDETGVANLIVRPKIYERYRRAARHSTAILCTGKVERQGAVVHVLAHSIRALSLDGAESMAMSRDFH